MAKKRTIIVPGEPEEMTTDMEVKEEARELESKTNFSTVVSNDQKIVEGKKYVIWFQKGVYKIFEKRGGKLLLIQEEKDKGKINKLWAQLESWNRRYEASEVSNVAGINFQF